MKRTGARVWKSGLWIALAISTFLLMTPRTLAQNITGEIDGTVYDSTGAVIPGASVAVKNQDTGLVVRRLKANSRGEYSAPSLQIGTYTLTFSQSGFESSDVRGIEVSVGGAVTQNVKLPVGQSSVSVTVNAEADIPDLETPTASTVIDSKQMNELALSTRNFEEVLLLQPGVSYGGADQLFPGLASANGSRNNPNFSINGLLPNQLTFQLDGADMLDHSGSVQVAITPGVDAIKQTQVLRSSFGAQYGGGGSAQVIVVTKAGTQAFHGNVFEFYRNPALNATPYFNKLQNPPKAKPDFTYNNFGGTFGGRVPHIKRTFFFVGMEARRMSSFDSYVQGNYPSEAELNGYFPTPVCAVVITGKPCTRATLVTNSPYPGNPFQIPKIDPTAQQYIKDVMQPALDIAVPADPSQPETAFIQDKSTYNSLQTLVRLDHQFSDRISAFVRYIYDPIHQDIPGALYAGPGYPGVGVSKVYSYGEDTLGHLTWTLTPTTVLELGSSYEQYQLSTTPYGVMLASNSPDVQVQLPFVNTRGTIPGLVINGGIWNTLGPYLYRGHTVQEFANVTKQFHAHTFYFGGNYEHYYSYTNSSFQSNAGQFVFTGAPVNVTATGANCTQPAVGCYSETVFQSAFASFLSGNPSSFSQSSIEPLSLDAASLYETYFQDNWRVTPRLTLDLGVRYTIYGQPYDRGGNLGGFQPDAYNPANAPAIGNTGNICLNTTTAGCAATVPNQAYQQLNGIVTQGPDSPYGKTISRTPLLNFAPRVGFALNVFGDGRTSLRGGYGVYYYQTQLSTVQGLATGNPAYVQTPSYSSPASFASPAAGTASNTLVQNVSGQVRNWKQPYTESFSLSLQQQLARGMLLDLAYVGNVTMHLPGEEDLNQPKPGAYLAAGLGGPIGSGPATTKLNQIRPYLGYGPIEFIDTRYRSDYNGFQASLVKRFSNGSSLGANYTWSKALANSQGLANVSGYATKAYVDPQNRYDLAAEWAPTLGDRRNMFNANFVYVIPYFRHQKSFKGKVLGGWEASAIVQMVGGNYGTVTQNVVDPAGLGVLNPSANTKPARVTQIGDPNTGPRTLKQWINTSAFCGGTPALTGINVNSPSCYTIGQANNEKPRGILLPGYQTWNIGFFRNFQMGESRRLQVRAEAINAFNHTSFQGVSLGINNTNFGQVTSAHQPRTMQVGGKFYF